MEALEDLILESYGSMLEENSNVQNQFKDAIVVYILCYTAVILAVLSTHLLLLTPYTLCMIIKLDKHYMHCIRFCRYPFERSVNLLRTCCLPSHKAKSIHIPQHDSDDDYDDDSDVEKMRSAVAAPGVTAATGAS